MLLSFDCDADCAQTKVRPYFVYSVVGSVAVSLLSGTRIIAPGWASSICFCR